MRWFRVWASRLLWKPPSRQIRSDDLTGRDAFNQGVKFGARGERDAAIAAYETAVKTSDSDLAPRALFNLAALRSDDVEVATSAYLAAVETNHPDVAPKAAFNLGWLLAAQGDLAGATTMLRRALAFGHDDVSARAALKLESVRAELLITRWPAPRDTVSISSARSSLVRRSTPPRRRSDPMRSQGPCSRRRSRH